MTPMTPITIPAIERISLAHRLSQDLLTTARQRLKQVTARAGGSPGRDEIAAYDEALTLHSTTTLQLLRETLALGQDSPSS